MTRAQLNASIDTVFSDSIADASLTPSMEGIQLKKVADYADQEIAVISSSLVNKVDKIAGYLLTKNDFTDLLKTAYDTTVTWITTNGSNLLNHLSNTNNPHNVTKSQVGLGNVYNTSDVNKPISTATQTALGLKQNSIKTKGTVVSLASPAYNVLTNDVNVITGAYNGHVLLPDTTVIGKEILVYGSGLGFYVDVSNVSTMNIFSIRYSETVPSYFVMSSQFIKFTCIGDGNWMAERISDNTLLLDGFPVFDYDIQMSFYSSDTTQPSLASLNTNYAQKPQGYRIFYPNMSGGAILITKLYSGVYYKTTLGTQIT